MEKKEIKIPSNKEKVFFQYISFINPMIGNLPKKELEVLAVILKYNNKYKHIPEVDRGLILFSSKIKSEMIDEIGCTANTFNIYFSKLNKKKLIVDEQVNPKISIYPDDKGLNVDVKILFVEPKIKLKKDESNNQREEQEEDINNGGTSSEQREIDTGRDDVSEPEGDSGVSEREESNSYVPIRTYGESDIELIEESDDDN